jgi:hypothetical protein
MKDVYTNAEDTIIWLGPETEDSTVALQRMEEFYASLPPTLHQGTENFLPLGTASVSLLPGPVSFRKDITSNTGVSSALTSFFRRHWFSRTWILQEVILSRKPVVMCGNATAPWAHVVATAAFLNLETMLHQGNFHITSLIASHAIKIEWISTSLKGSTSSGTPSPSLLDVVSNADRFDATDPRDKIFGLLGLVEKFSCRFSRLSSYSQRSLHCIRRIPP